MNRLFLILGDELRLPIRLHRHRRRQRHRGRELRLHECALADRRHRRRRHSLGIVLVVDVGDVIRLEAFFAVRGKEIFATQLHAPRVAVMVMRERQLHRALLVFSIEIGIDDLV